MHISVKQLATRYGVTPATIWRWTKNGEFPQPVKLGPNCTRWRESDILAWERSRLTEAG